MYSCLTEMHAKSNIMLTRGNRKLSLLKSKLSQLNAKIRLLNKWSSHMAKKCVIRMSLKDLFVKLNKINEVF